MKPPTIQIRRAALAVAGTLAVTIAALAPTVAGAAEEGGGLAGSDLYLNPYSTTLEAAQSLSGQARADAQLLGSIPSADWITKGTPSEAQAAVDEIVDAASARGEMPVIVAYNLPFRDCAQYSAGGAANTADYKAWIDGVAAGIGGRPATVILEPDGLGIIPHYTTINGETEWCQPAEIPAATAASDRFTQLNYAVEQLKKGANTSVYLDGTGPSWLGVGDIADRLVKGGVEHADGFFLNASNYQFTVNATYYGTWVSSCLALGVGAFKDGCGNQYWNGGPATGWNGVAMSQYGEWSPDAVDPALNTSGIDSRYANDLGGVEPSTHFVIDTSRNGLGPWDFPEGVYPVHEDWCNPPDRGAGARPSTETGNPLVDAHLWIKVPGESDGQCYRGTGGPLDPARGIEDPAAGQWFVQQARELIANANPPLAPLDCNVKVTGSKTAMGFLTTLVIHNQGSESVQPWTLSWTFDGDQKVTSVVGGVSTQIGADVTVTATKLQAKLTPGKKATVIVKGTGAAAVPWLFYLNGKACASG
jgi:endoglucanase